MIPVAANRECDEEILEEWVEIDDVDDAIRRTQASSRSC